MRERAEPTLKVVCLLLAACVLYELAGALFRINPLHGVVVPALPSLVSRTNSPPGGHGTNPVPMAAAVTRTNHLQRSVESDSAPFPVTAKTNFTVRNERAETNAVLRREVKINQTNVPSSAAVLTTGTNLLAGAAPGTNIAHHPKSGRRNAGSRPGPEMAGMNFNSFAPAGKRVDDLPPAIQARISRISDSEILGPVMRPLPMALLGIAGEVAFLRTDSGQTGLVKEGDSLGELKLLRIGINRVLIEQDGQKKELTIFSGYGGESLLPKQKETPDENNHP